jgi:hypothetical protein
MCSDGLPNVNKYLPRFERSIARHHCSSTGYKYVSTGQLDEEGFCEKLPAIYCIIVTY